MTRAARIALIVAAIALVCTVGVCATGAALAPQLAEVAGCPTSRGPQTSGVQDDPKRVEDVLPVLGPVTSVHWRWREARPRTCPDLGPMDYVYEGFAVLTPERAVALRAEYPWGPAQAPDVPEELGRYAPASPAWQRSTSTAVAPLWLDAGSSTVYFRYVRG